MPLSCAGLRAPDAPGLPVGGQPRDVQARILDQPGTSAASVSEMSGDVHAVLVHADVHGVETRARRQPHRPPGTPCSRGAYTATSAEPSSAPEAQRFPASGASPRSLPRPPAPRGKRARTRPQVMFTCAVKFASARAFVYNKSPLTAWSGGDGPIRGGGKLPVARVASSGPWRCAGPDAWITRPAGPLAEDSP